MDSMDDELAPEEIAEEGMVSPLVFWDLFWGPLPLPASVARELDEIRALMQEEEDAKARNGS